MVSKWVGLTISGGLVRHLSTCISCTAADSPRRLHSREWIPSHIPQNHLGSCFQTLQCAWAWGLCQVLATEIKMHLTASSNIRFSHNVITFETVPRKMGNSHHVGMQWDGSFYDNLSKCKETRRMFLACVELGEIPLCKFKKAKLSLSVRPVHLWLILPYTAIMCHVQSCVYGLMT